MAAILAFFIGGFFGWFIAALSVVAFHPNDSEYNERNGSHR